MTYVLWHDLIVFHMLGQRHFNFLSSSVILVKSKHMNSCSYSWKVRFGTPRSGALGRICAQGRLCVGPLRVPGGILRKYTWKLTQGAVLANQSVSVNLI